MSKKGYNRQKARRHRRRWQYPELLPGQVATIIRPECGMNISRFVFDPERPTNRGNRRVLNGKFEFIRDLMHTSRSKYMPSN